MDHRKILTFILFAYGISWLIWLPAALNSLFDLAWTISPWNHIAGGLGPFLGAIITTFIFEKKAGVKKYFQGKLLTFPRIKWLLIGFGMPVLFFLVPYAFALFRGEWVRWSYFGMNSKIPVEGTIWVWLMWCFFYGLGEEGGWRGLLFPELAKKFKARTAALLVALIWAPWHLPVFFYDKDFMSMGAGGIIGWVVGLSFGSVLLAWLVKQSRWNLWPVLLWHGTFNLFTTSDMFAPFFPAVMSMLVMVVVVWIAIWYGPELDRSHKKQII
jgi:membrane protease YdiL (CAAX protease family)